MLGIELESELDSRLLVRQLVHQLRYCLESEDTDILNDDLM